MYSFHPLFVLIESTEDKLTASILLSSTRNNKINEKTFTILCFAVKI